MSAGCTKGENTVGIACSTKEHARARDGRLGFAHTRITRSGASPPSQAA